jgi:hypothetical protein
MLDAPREKRHNMATARNHLNYLHVTVDAITNDATVNRIFRVLLDTSSSSGWAIAKSVGMAPEEVDRGLQTLVKYKVIDSDGTGLDGFYHVTAPGYQLREYL